MFIDVAAQRHQSLLVQPEPRRQAPVPPLQLNHQRRPAERDTGALVDRDVVPAEQRDQRVLVTPKTPSGE